MARSEEKRRRVLAALERREPDRVPIGEFFWSNFLKRCRRDLNVGRDFDPYRYWDLDLVVINPNMDPHLTGIRIIEETDDRQVVRTGFGALIERRRDLPMPRFLDFETQTFNQMDRLVFDDPADDRRYLAVLDDQINSVGDALNLDTPSFADRVNAYAEDFCVFGSVCEPHEMMWRIIGTENALVKLIEDTPRMAAFAERLGEFLEGIVKGQIAAAEGRLSGLYLWGDVAFDGGMLFSPAIWREVYKPQVERLCNAIHAAGLKVIYHGCGNASTIFEDLLEAGVDAYNPIEAKSGLDVVDLKRRYGRRWSFNGNLDVRVLATNDRDRVRREVLYKLNAAKDGGYIIQSDHSVPDNVEPATYDYAVRLVREHGQYPLDLGEFDEDVSERREVTA